MNRGESRFNPFKTISYRKMSVNETKSGHLNIFFEIVYKIREIEIEIADDLLCILRLYSVPENFENFSVSLDQKMNYIN